MLNMEVVNIKRVEGFDKLKAFIDIVVGDHLTIRGLRLVGDPKGDWIGYPQKSYQSNGKTKYSPIVEVTESLKKQIRELIIKEYEKN